MLYDVFISHAYEDKEDFVKPLADKLIENNVEVWYDEYTLSLGDRLRRSIDKGLSESTYGIVVFSNNFFNKSWSQYELDGLLQLQSLTVAKRILPIWHNITKEEIIKYSPPLADLYAISSNQDIELIVEKILNVIKPKGSSLIVARDILLQYSNNPPVISDDWWLDISIHSGKTEPYSRWEFPIEYHDGSSKERGRYIAWHAMQLEWTEYADEYEITQITHPDIVLDFINKHPGLKEKCIQYPDFLLAYAPQMAISGFEGYLEETIESFYINSVNKQKKYIEGKSRFGSGLTTNGLPAECEEILAIRHQTFGNNKPSHVACTFTQGELMWLSPKYYEIIDYIIWLLSSNSSWLPEKIKEYLLTGYEDWGVWTWTDYGKFSVDSLENNSTGKLLSAIYNHDKKKLTLTKAVKEDILTRFEYTKNLLELKDSPELLVEKFLERKFISKILEKYFTDRNTRRK